MSVEKIANVTDPIAIYGAKGNASGQRQSKSESTLEDVVSIGNSENDFTRLKWPPLFPIGDAQCIFKIEK